MREEVAAQERLRAPETVLQCEVSDAELGEETPTHARVRGGVMRKDIYHFAQGVLGGALFIWSVLATWAMASGVWRP
jgi:hypothetical protein